MLVLFEKVCGECRATVEREGQGPKICQYVSLDTGNSGCQKFCQSWKILSNVVIICHQPKLVYLAVPRTASTAITATLKQAFPDCVVLAQHRTDVPERYRRGDYFIFASVRNPYQRMVSHYLHRRCVHPASVGHWTFAEYVRNLSRQRMPWWGLANDPSADAWLQRSGCRRVIHYERLQEEWAALPVWREAKVVPPLLRNNAATEPYDWRLFYTDALARQVYLFHRPDFEVYGYARDSWRLGVAS